MQWFSYQGGMKLRRIATDIVEMCISDGLKEALVAMWFH